MTNRIVIAAGHGGGDSGAVGQGSQEATEAIQIVARVVSKMQADGRIIVDHISDALGLQAEINYTNAHYKQGDGIALEIHKNSGGGHGSQVHYFAGDATAQARAAAISAAIASSTGLPDRGAQVDNSPALVARIGGPLGWTRKVNMESYLIEAGFIDSDAIDDNADERFAEGIYQGILKVLGLAAKAAPAPAAPAPAPEPGRGSAATAGMTPIDLSVIVTASNLMVRSGPGKAFAGGLGLEADGKTALNGTGNLVAGNRVHLKGYVAGEDVDLTGQGGQHTNLWGVSDRDKSFWLGGTDFFTRMAALQAPVPAPVAVPVPAPAPAPAPEPSPQDLYAAKYGITLLPAGSEVIYPKGEPNVRDMDTSEVTAINPTEPATVKYAALSGGAVYYVTEYSHTKMAAIGFRADEWTTTPPAAPEPTPAPAPAAVPEPVVAAPAAPSTPVVAGMDGIIPPTPAPGYATTVYPPVAQPAPEKPSLQDIIALVLAAILAHWPFNRNK